MKNAGTFFRLRLDKINTLHNRFLLSGTILCFALIFMYLFKPFGIDYWIGETFGNRNTVILSICLFSFAVIFTSQIIQFFLFRNKSYTLSHFIVGIIAEVVVISLPLAYASTNEYSSFSNELIITLRLIAATLLFCYFVSTLILYALNLGNNAVITNIENSAAEVQSEDENSLPNTLSMFSIYDDNGQLRFSVNSNDLLFIESADNYVMVHYLRNENYCKQLVRTTLKSIEADAGKAGCVRCHRSYLINKHKIGEIKKNGRQYEVHLHHIHQAIPISKSYQAELI
ncbi:MAG: LytR/AlgR family response regulator transcription factor [Tannerellaceae bacterium]